MYFNVTAHFCANALNTETLSKPFKQARGPREKQWFWRHYFSEFLHFDYKLLNGPS